MATWRDGVFLPGEDLRGEYIRARMRERYPQIEDEVAILNYGTEAERAEHAEYRAMVKADADRLYPKEMATPERNDAAGEASGNGGA